MIGGPGDSIGFVYPPLTMPWLPGKFVNGGGVDGGWELPVLRAGDPKPGPGGWAAAICMWPICAVGG